MATKVKPKWGVAVFRDAVIGPFKFKLMERNDFLFEDLDIPDPLNMEHWSYATDDYDCCPTRLFQTHEKAQLFADGARCARQTLIEFWGEDMTTKFDEQAD